MIYDLSYNKYKSYYIAICILYNIYIHNILFNNYRYIY